MFETIIMFVLIGFTMEALKEASKTPGMARITLGSIVNGISGSIDQMVYSTWKGINYVRSKAKTINNRQTTGQMSIRARIAECAKYWNDVLDATGRGLWEQYSKTIVIPSSSPGDIIKPSKGPFSGYTAFLRNNVNTFASGSVPLGTFLAAPPIGVTPPDAVQINSAVWNPATKKIDITYTLGNVPPSRVEIWMRSVSGIVHAQLVDPISAAGGVISEGYLRGADGTWLALENLLGLYDVQMLPVDGNGQPGPASNLIRGVQVV